MRLGSPSFLFKIKGLGGACTLLGIDQLSKFYLIHHIQTPVYLAPWFSLVYVQNPGISFRLLRADSPWQIGGLAFLSLSIVLFLIYLYNKSQSRYLAIGFVLMVGGALGNITDRLCRGGVIDFLSFHWRGFFFPVFNFADIFITLGAFLLVLNGWFKKEGPQTIEGVKA